MTALPTCGAVLWALGYRTTKAQDTSQGHPGVPVTGSFNLGADDPVARYGFSLAGKEYEPEQNAGAHARARADGLRQSDAPALLPQVLAKAGFQAAANVQRDTADLTMLVGATQWVLDQALAFGLVSLPAPQPPVTPPSPPVQPPSPPVAPPSQPPTTGTGLRPLSPASVRVEEMRIIAGKLLQSVPTFSGWASGLLLGPTTWPLLNQPLASLLRSFRWMNKAHGDTREIPAEDR